MLHFPQNIIILVVICFSIWFLIACSSIKKSSGSNSIDYSDSQSESQQEYPFETGIASYYSSVFEGRATASGEIYSGEELTAAHRTLPFGTIVRVRNLKNNKSVIVKINDRGPSKSDRVIDLSYRAAFLLDMIRDGIVKVEITVIKK